MALTLEKIYYIAMRKYKMNLVAGKEGITANVSWLHVVEEIKYASFLTGGELVLYTGAKTGSGNIIDFIREIARYKASGLVINVGGYIREIPQEIIDYANENSFPVFTLPWEVRLVEISREFGSMIIRSEENEKSLCSAFKSAIFSPEEVNEYLPFFKKHNLFDKKYCLIKCRPEIEYAHIDPDITKLYYELREVFERVLNRYREIFVIFRHEQYLTMIIPEVHREECQEIISLIQRNKKSVKNVLRIYFAVSRFNISVENLSREYNNLSSVIKMMKKEDENICYREDLGLINVIFAADNTKNLIEYKNETIGKLEKYDAENNTNYVGILKTYLEKDCNMNDAAKEFYLHRNTFAYHMNKISELLNVDLYSMNDRTKLLVAIKIKDLYEL